MSRGIELVSHKKCPPTNCYLNVDSARCPPTTHCIQKYLIRQGPLHRRSVSVRVVGRLAESPLRSGVGTIVAFCFAPSFFLRPVHSFVRGRHAYTFCAVRRPAVPARRWRPRRPLAGARIPAAGTP